MRNAELRPLITNPYKCFEVFIFYSFRDNYEYLNGLEGLPGFIYANYSPDGTTVLAQPRMYFSSENAKKMLHALGFMGTSDIPLNFFEIYLGPSYKSSIKELENN